MFEPGVKKGLLYGKGQRFVLVVSRFNSLVTDRLEEGARDSLLRHGVRQEDLSVVHVPGAFEIPLAASWVARKHKPDGIVCLGAVIQGGTSHFDYVAGGVANGIASVSLETGIPAGFGVLTCDTLEQALERAGGKAGNKGREAAVSTLEMASLARELNPA